MSSRAFAIAGTLRWDSGWDSCYRKFNEQISARVHVGKSRKIFDGPVSYSSNAKLNKTEISFTEYNALNRIKLPKLTFTLLWETIIW